MRRKEVFELVGVAVGTMIVVLTVVVIYFATGGH
jgi:hypothetical protein